MKLYSYHHFKSLMIANHISEEAKLCFKTHCAEKIASVAQSVRAKPQRAYSARQDRRQQMNTQRWAEKHEEMIRQLCSEPVHSPNTPGRKLTNKPTTTSWIPITSRILPYRSEIQWSFIADFYFFSNST